MRTQETESKTWAFVMDGSCKLCAEGHRDNATTGRVEVHVAPTKIVVTPTGTNTGGYSLAEMWCGGMKVRSTIDELFQINIPPFSLLDGTVHVEDFTQVSMTSIERAQEIQKFLILFNPLQTDAAVPVSESDLIPFDFHMKGANVYVQKNKLDLVVKRMRVCVDSILVESITYIDSSRNGITTSDITIKPKSRSSAEILVRKVQKLDIPGTLSLSSPIENLAVDLSTDSISVKLQALHLSLQKQDDANPSDILSEGSKHSEQKDEGNFAFNVALSISNLQIDMFHGRNTLQLENLCLSAFSSGLTVKTEIQRKLNVRVSNSHSDWIEGDIKPFTVETYLLDPVRLQVFHSMEGCSVTASSFGSLEMNVAESSFEAFALQTVTRPELLVGHAELKCGDMVILQKVQDFISNVIAGCEIGNGDDDSGAMICSPFPICFQGAKLSVVDQAITLFVGPISLHDNIILFDEIICSGPYAASCRVKNAKVVCSSSAVEVLIGIIDEICLPQQGLSIDPITPTFTFEDNVLQIRINKIEARLIQTMEGEPAIEEIKAGAMSDLKGGIELPFNIAVEVSHAALALHAGTSVCATGLKMNASSEDNLLNIDMMDKTNIRYSYHEDWLDMNLQPCFAAFSNLSLFPTAFCIGGLSIGPCSLGTLDATIPSFTLLPDDTCITLDNMMSVTIESFELLQRIQELYTKIQEDNSSNSATEASSVQCELPFSIEAPTFEFCVNEPRAIVRCQNLSVRENKLQCGLLSADAATLNLSAKNCSLDVLAGTDIIVKVEEVTTANLTGMVSLAEPCRDLSVHFREGNLYIDVPSAKCDAISSPISQGNGKGSASISVSVPIPTQLRVQSFIFQNLSLQSSISVENFAVGVKQSGSSINIRTGKDLKVKGQHSEHWIGACVDSANACIAFEDGAYFVKELKCLGMLIGPASPSCGSFKATISKLHHDGESLEISETVNASMQQLDSRIVASAQTLLQALSGLVPTEEASFELPFPIKVPTIRAAVIEPKITIDIDGVSAVITTVCCKKIDAAMFQQASVSLADVNFDFKSMQFEMGLVQSLFLRGMLVLSKPVRQAKIEFNDDLSIQLPHPVHINMLSMEKNDESSSQNTENPDLPFPINVDIHELNVSQQGQDSSTRIDGASLKVESFVFGGQDLYEDQPLKGAKVSMKINQASSDLFKVADICCLFVLPLHDLNVLKNMQLSMSSMQVRAGFSSIDWNSFLSSKKDQVPTNTTPTIKAPFSQIGSFHLSISYEGKILASQSNILVPSFNGDASTTSETITTHYTKTIMSRVPGFLTNAKFMGGNIVDSSLQTAAIATSRVAGKITVGGAGVGSVIGVAVGDAIRAGVTSGKKSRNVDTSDGYKFGDFTRGLTRGAREAASTGAKMRGGDKAYIPGDLTAGSTRAMGEYASNNKSKLASAGGSGVASMVGLAVAGPLGFVAGAYYGGKAVKNVVGEDTHDGKHARLLQLYLLQALNLHCPPSSQYTHLRQLQWLPALINLPCKTLLIPHYNEKCPILLQTCVLKALS